MGDFDPNSFATVHVVAGVVILKGSKVLLVQEAYKKVRGQWNLPGGRVDKGETLERAAIREAKEEVGLDVKLGKHLRVIHQNPQEPVLHAFLAKSYSGNIKIDPEEMLDAKWFDVGEVLSMQGLRNEEYIRGAIKAAVEVSDK